MTHYEHNKREITIKLRIYKQTLETVIQLMLNECDMFNLSVTV